LTDNLTTEQRSYCMSQVRNKGTGLEQLIENALRTARIKFKRNHTGLPGSPDFVIASLKTAVFVDGDFWHGYRFPSWAGSLSPFWKEKIQRNRARDRRSHAALRRMGWRVVRLWQHQIKQDVQECLKRILNEE
jgi:DNA mismatch endonuclease (patch repair protein)